MKLECLKCLILLTVCLAVAFAVPTWAKLPEHIVFLMTFEDASGDTVSDMSGYENSGTIIGKEKWGAGKYGGGLYFDGSTHVTVPNSSPLKEITHPMSIGAWVNPDGFGGWRVITEIEGAAGWQFQFSEKAIVWTTRNVKDFFGQTPVESGKWTHVAAVWDGSEALIYINGEEDAGGPIAGGGVINVENEPSLDIGSERAAASYFYQGWMDDLWIINEALDKQDIQSLMNDFGALLSVKPGDKAAVTWGKLKVRLARTSPDD